MSYLFGVTRLLSINNKPIRITAVKDSWLIHKPKPHMAIFNSFDLILVELNRWKRKPWSSSCTLYAFMRSRGSTLGPSSESWFWSSVRTVSSMLRSKTQEDRDGEVQVNSWRGRIVWSTCSLKGWKQVSRWMKLKQTSSFTGTDGAPSSSAPPGGWPTHFSTSVPNLRW